MQHRHERPGLCGHHNLTTTTDARVCRVIIADPTPWRRALGVDGKTLRGAKRDGRRVHLLAAMDHASRAALAQRQVDGAPGEVPGLQPPLADLDLATSRWHTVVVYAITSLPFAQARPARLADLLRGHWAIENACTGCGT